MAYLSTIQSLEEMKDAHITLALAANDVDIVAMYIDLAELMSHQLHILLQRSRQTVAVEAACNCILSCGIIIAEA
jgi:hypothetical protein